MQYVPIVVCNMRPYSRKTTMIQSKRLTGTELYEIPPYKDGETENSMCCCMEYDIKRAKNFLQSTAPYVPVNTQIKTL